MYSRVCVVLCVCLCEVNTYTVISIVSIGFEVHFFFAYTKKEMSCGETYSHGSSFTGTDIWIDLPEESYEKVMALAKMYRRRLENGDALVVDSNPEKEKECIQLLEEEEVGERLRIEKREHDVFDVLMRRWAKRSKGLASQFSAIRIKTEKRAQEARERVLLKEQLYRQQFLEFWEKTRGERHNSRGFDGATRVIMNAYLSDAPPFAADPVEFWERGLSRPPEDQRPVVLSDKERSILLPTFHELSAKLREAYDQRWAQEKKFAHTRVFALDRES